MLLHFIMLTLKLIVISILKMYELREYVNEIFCIIYGFNSHSIYLFKSSSLAVFYLESSNINISNY